MLTIGELDEGLLHSCIYFKCIVTFIKWSLLYIHMCVRHQAWHSSNILLQHLSLRPSIKEWMGVGEKPISGMCVQHDNEDNGSENEDNNDNKDNHNENKG